MSYWVYILQSAATHGYYVGHSEAPLRRLEDEHNKGRSRSTKAGIPWELVYLEAYATRSAASKREREIKAKKSRQYIDWLIG